MTDDVSVAPRDMRERAAVPDWYEAVLASPFPVAVADLETLAVVEANDGARRIFERREGRRLGGAEGLAVRAEHRDLANLVRSGRLDGFETHVEIATAGGASIGARVWVRRVQIGDDPRRHALVVVSEDLEPDVLGSIARHDVAIASGATDPEWRVVWVTKDIVEVLGYDQHELLGEGLLGLVHPEAAADVVTALGQAAHQDRGAVVHGRLRDRGSGWRRVQLIVTPRPGLGGAVMFVLSPASSAVPRDPLGLAATIERRLHDIMRDIHTAGLARDGDWAQLDTARRVATDLSTRQWEIVTRLRRGERVPDIARAMHLSPRTVRNHLTAVFRKFAVHSQAQLLAALRGDDGQ